MAAFLNTLRLIVRNMGSAYEAARQGRRLSGWKPTSSGPNTLLLGNLDTLRSRSRDAGRNNAWISHGIRSLVADEIGTGIQARARSKDAAFNAAADALWERWIEECDADGALNFYGMLALAARGRIEAGEVFLRARPRRIEDGLSVPLQLQLLEADHCPLNYMRGNVRAGIEFDGIGRKAAYWMHRSHPGDRFGAVDRGDLIRVPADTLIQHFAPLRPGQLRGTPWTVQALIKAKDFDEYDDAELVRKKNRSSYTGFLKRAYNGESDWDFDPLTGAPLKTDASDTPMANVEPGSWMSGLPGEEPVLFDGDPTGQGYADFVRQQLLGVAVGMGVPYEVLTGDWGKTNDRLARVILNQYRRILEQTQWLLTIPQVCARVREWFTDYAVASGALAVRNYRRDRADYLRTEWRTDGWAYIHPVQDVQAKLLKINGGLSSQTAECAEEGWDAAEIDRQNAEDAKRHEQYGLKYAATSVIPEDEEDEDGSAATAKLEAANAAVRAERTRQDFYRNLAERHAARN